MPRKKNTGDGQAGATTPGKAARRAVPAAPDTEKVEGVLMSEFKSEKLRYLWEPYIARGVLTLVVGQPCVGKSSFLAALIAYATTGKGLGSQSKAKASSVVFLPGMEEDINVMTAPRLRRAGANLSKIHVLAGKPISLCRDRDKLAGIVKKTGATLLIGDPIDSYVDEGMSEDRGQDVRPLLEAAVFIAKETGAACVFARHPGKDPTNICPGSRQWRAVPRSILQLTSDGSVPPQLMLSHYKDSLGTHSKPRRYALERDGALIPRFVLQEEIDRSAEELQANSGGPTGRFKLMASCRLIVWLFAHEDKPTRPMLSEEARKQGLSEDTVYEALRMLKVKAVPPTERGLPWLLERTEPAWPDWLTPQPAV